MSITSRDFFKDFDDMFSDFELFMRPRWPAARRERGGQRGILCDMKETPDRYTICAEVPGVKKEDMKIAVHEGVLEISGEQKQEKEEKDEKHHLIERRYGKFSRKLRLPHDADPTKISADLKDGILTLRVPKSERSKPVEIKIN